MVRAQSYVKVMVIRGSDVRDGNFPGRGQVSGGDARGGIVIVGRMDDLSRRFSWSQRLRVVAISHDHKSTSTDPRRRGAVSRDLSPQRNDVAGDFRLTYSLISSVARPPTVPV